MTRKLQKLQVLLASIGRTHSLRKLEKLQKVSLQQILWESTWSFIDLIILSLSLFQSAISNQNLNQEKKLVKKLVIEKNDN